MSAGRIPRSGVLHVECPGSFAYVVVRFANDNSAPDDSRWRAQSLKPQSPKPRARSLEPASIHVPIPARFAFGASVSLQHWQNALEK